MIVPRQQKTPSSRSSPTSTAHSAPTNPSPPKDYEKIVQSLINRRDISLEVKIDLWKRFAEYEACVDEEEHKNDEEPPVFTNTNATTVGEIGPDAEMPVPWMEDVPDFGSGNGEVWYTGGGGDSGSDSVDGVEQVEGDEVMDDGAPTEEEEENSDVAEQTVEEKTDATDGTSRDQEKDVDDSNENGNDSAEATTQTPGAESTCTTTITSDHSQETEADVANTTAATIDHSQQPDPLSNPPTDLPHHPTPATPTPAPGPSTTFTQVRHDIRTYFADLAERERLLAAREKWVTSRAEALWRNAKVLGGILRREVDRKEGKRVVREFGGGDGGEEERGRKRTRRV
ncbi:hypothetical protein VE00_02103 [Pseudogymnoascus sp. WSF 3629]|nr:hypothetical protein VE00_02103 [Pseudogymnoascus sp. WSF 3629]